MNGRTIAPVILSQILSVLLAFLTEPSFASETSHGEVPKTVLYQFGNLGALFVLYFIFLRPKVAEAFKGRAKKFEELAQKSRSLVEEAGKKNEDLRRRLEKLNASAEGSINKASEEALLLRKTLVLEAQKVAGDIRLDSDRIVQMEFERAKGEIREDLIRDSVLRANEELRRGVAPGDQQRLNREFLERLSEVR